VYRSLIFVWTDIKLFKMTLYNFRAYRSITEYCEYYRAPLKTLIFHFFKLCKAYNHWFCY